MTSKELYKKGARVWIPNAELVWEGAVLDKNYSEDEITIRVTTDGGERREIAIKSENDLPHLRNPTILIGQNDLTSLSFLHEPDVLYNLEIRFKERQVIYTYCGIILVAINPYHDLPIYGSDIIRAYRGHSMGELEPHIFAVSEEAYAKLEREKGNISIIVSGESGAGKTVSAKYSMRYFAAVGGNESETHIEKKVLASSPIMESIGNAKTIRNDNSSRFGKFTKLMFVNKNLTNMSLTGATMQTYLLEKSRVVSQSAGERNYHIFYQLCAGRELFPELSLKHKDAFNILNQGSSSDKQDDTRDLQNFHETLSALETLCFSKNEIDNIFKVIAGILHLGNVNIDANNQDSCSVDRTDESLNAMCNILKLEKSECIHWLTTRQIESINEIVKIPMSKETSEAARDALAKYLYSKLFNFIVQTVNRNLSSDKNEEFFIGVLDIYGFETFETNSFEQFCINYANEKLQQQFNQHVFKLEQEEYLKEGIVWTMIDFYDNQPCIDLIESKLGILDLLDEECRVPNGSDVSWVGKLNDKCSKYPHYEKARFGTSSFFIKHFSDVVDYECFGFLEKNRDTVSKELVNVILSSKLEFCQSLFTLDDEKSPYKTSTVPSNKSRVSIDSRSKTLPLKQQKQTVGSQFRDSLSQLISTLHSTTPHYVRCIKPNENKTPFDWDAKKIVQQLRACGVLETVRISAAGFPSRWKYDDFYDRYRLLCKRADIVDWNVKATCTNIVRNWLTDDDKFRFGHTQIFFRAGQVAYLEQLRFDMRKKYIIRIQSAIRRFICRRKYLRIRSAVVGLQRYARGFLARRKAQDIRENRAATTIQRHIKGWYHRRRFLMMQKAIVGIQRYGRGFLVRKRFANVLDNFKAIQIQRFCRGYLARKTFQEKIRKITLAQACVRRRLAKKRLKELRAEARSISHLQTKYKGLENKIIELQQKYDAKNKDNEKLKIENSVIPKLRIDLDGLKNVESELKALKVQMSVKEDQIISIQKMLDRELDEKMSLIEEKAREDEQKAEEQTMWQLERQELKNRNNELTDLAEQAVKKFESETHENFKREKEVLEQKSASLKKEVERLQLIIDTPCDADSSRFDNNDNDKILPSNEGNVQSTTSTLERKFKRFFGFQNSNSSSPEPKSSSPETTALILRMRRLLEEEKNKGDSLESELVWMRSKTNSTTSAGDTIRLSELECENEKLRQDYELLRNSIHRGVEQQEMEAQYSSMVEELKRRRDECIQLRTILSQQSQSLSHTSSNSLKSYEANDLADALQAQKNANTQLEAELQALTEMHKMKLIELTKEIDNLRSDYKVLEEIFHDKIETENEGDIKKIIQRENYLKVELSRLTTSYVHSQEQLTLAKREIQELQDRVNKLTNTMRDNGLNDSVIMNGDVKGELVGVVKKKNQKSQGILKHQHDDEEKIIKRLVIDLTTRTAMTLNPGLPAYVLFMCVRYTDLLNADNRVKSLLTSFILSVKKTYKTSTTLDMKILWIVNSIKLQELLMQYGGHEEYMRFNTDRQNEQQLKNFDLSEYCVVIKEAINYMYDVLIRRLEESIKPMIVPAILFHDETAKGKNRRGLSIESPGEENKVVHDPQTLVDQLEYFHKRFLIFGLDNQYIEQVFEQLFYYICAVALNNLMLRSDLCTWKTGMKLKYNVGCLESWVKEKKMPETIVSPSSSLTEAALLMQSRKSDADVDSIVEICPTLTPSQILKLLKSYTTDDCEDPISQNFIESLSKKLNAQENETFTMNENEIRQLCVTFKYNEMKLEDIEISDALKLNNLVTKI